MAISKHIPTSKNLVQLSTMVLSTLAAFLPKCALCWAAYASIFSALGISTVFVSELIWVYPVLVLMVMFNLYSMYNVAKQRQSYQALYMNMGGIGLLLLQRYAWDEPILIYLGLAMIIWGAWSNYVSGNLMCKIPMRKNLLTQ